MGASAHPTDGWDRKIRRADRTARVISRRPLVVDFTSTDKRGAVRAQHLGPDGDELLFSFEVKRLGIPTDLRVVPETTATRMWQRVRGPDVQTGDAPFDDLANLSGPPAWILAAMTNRTRKDLKTILENGGRVEAGHVHARIRLHRARQIVAHAAHLLRLAKRLSLPDSEVVRQLVRRIRDVQRPEIRRAHVKRLIGHAPLIDRFEILRPVDRELAQGDDAARAQARALRLAWVKGDPGRMAQLDEARVLPLMDAASPIRLAAIARLGAIGTQSAIAPLTAASRGFFTSSSVKRAARIALEQVIERVGHVEAGGLALSEGDGKLSL